MRIKTSLRASVQIFRESEQQTCENKKRGRRDPVKAEQEREDNTRRGRESLLFETSRVSESLQSAALDNRRREEVSVRNTEGLTS
jgi:hypothetical protein